MSGFKESYVDVRIYRWTKSESDRNEILSPLDYTSSDGTLYTVPKGFRTNFASIPRIFRSIIEPTGKWTNASVLHDYLYENGYKMGVSRKKADKLFYDAMIDSHVANITANIMWFCVRAFGYFNYKRKD